ncbi:YggS family pyridoxal phosphate-dependent enzyme [Blastopirellula marina]|uniref:Pyridoxal phosphate homeostasis protein n=1 Tax=Blastopirellula marina TaxID=124 RepID=A0A2S8F0L3_9BACT|nr:MULTISPECIES: YggS family pyridoxal phosphate-dependent enzyme [Pirellulaceae]PQO25454.1 YggS family pyridoxal phosphate-dependent enzyme [Blastopirellula marina]RCS42418.1 YggS family pyridoxal phosphate-dependent enzyme [Bremerella cremea]
MHTQLRENLDRVRGMIAEAAQASGRVADDVCLIGVTKYVDIDTTKALYELGCHDLGESRPQQLWAKSEAMAHLSPRWHMIGHLQRNKTKRTIPLLSVLHAGDSVRLLQAAHADWPHADPLPTLLEVNISGDAAKHGFPPAEIPPALRQIAALNHLKIVGLMGMASLEGGRDQAQKDFAALRELRDQLRSDCPDEILLDELSMGMSHDFDLAIREGATMVRVGSSLFEGFDGGH